MNKKTFIRRLSSKLRALPFDERAQSLAYYAEMIDDRMEEGMGEEQAVAQLGSVEEIAAQLLQDAPRTARPSGRRSGWTIALLVLGSPVWLSLMIALLAVALSLYVVLWSLVAVLYAVEFALMVGGPAGLLGMAVGILRGNLVQAGMFFADGCALLGLALILLPPLNRLARGLVRASAWGMRKIGRLFRGRGKA